MSTSLPDSVCFYAITGDSPVATGGKEHFFSLDSGGCSTEVACVDRGYIALRRSMVDPEEVTFVPIRGLVYLLALHRRLSEEFPQDGLAEYPSHSRQALLREVLPEEFKDREQADD